MTEVIKLRGIDARYPSESSLLQGARFGGSVYFLYNVERMVMKLGEDAFVVTLLPGSFLSWYGVF